MAEGGIVKGIRVPDGQKVSNSRVKPKGDISSELGCCWFFFLWLGSCKVKVGCQHANPTPAEA